MKPSCFLWYFFALCLYSSERCHAQIKTPEHKTQEIHYITDSDETPYIFIKIKTSKNKALLFLYDTGANDNLVITPATLKMFPSAKKDGDYFVLDKITITSESGDIVYKQIRSTCEDLIGLKGTRIENVAGIIGCRFFGNDVISINPQSRTITLGKKKANHLKDFTRINLESHPNDKRPYIKGYFSQEDNCSFLVDTGAVTSIIRISDFDKIPDGAIWRDRAFPVMDVVGGKANLQECLTTVHFNGFKGDITAKIVEKNVRFAASASYQKKLNLLGIDFLKRFELTFDYNEKLLYLRRTEKYASETVPPGSVGITAATDPVSSEPFVYAVEYNSKAYKAGVRPSDVIAGIDGKKPRKGLIQEQIDGKAGSTLQLTILRKNRQGQKTKLDFSIVRDNSFLPVPVADDLPSLGVVFSFSLTGELTVKEVYEDSVAASTGLREGDVVLEMSNMPMKNSSPEELIRIIKTLNSKDLRIRILREGKMIDYVIKSQKG